MAAAEGGVRVEGLKELVRHLQSLGVEVQDLKGVFGELSTRAAGAAASFAPHRSGKLAASIRGSKAKNYATVKAGGARVPYAGAINYGWRRRHIAPSGFMQRADAVVRPTVVPAIEQAINLAIAARGL